MELYSFASCPFAQRTRMALIEKGLNCTLTEIDLYDRPAWFASVSPYGKVPVLRHDGVTVYESAIINQYLDEAFPQPPLMPADPAGRARARIWMDHCDTRFLPATRAVMSEDDPTSHAAAVARLGEVLRFIEQQALAQRSPDGPFFLGDRLTLVDLQFAPFFERWGLYEQLGGAEWPADCTRLRAWLSAMQDRPSWQQTCQPVERHIEAHHEMRARIAGR